MSYYDIECLAEIVNDLFTAAKRGTFDEVFRILSQKPYLLNCIPDNRRWGILHQAVYWRNSENLKKLIKIPECDLRTKAKTCFSDGIDSSGMTALELARKKGYTELIPILQYHTFEKQHIPTFQNERCFELIKITLATYKSTFCPGWFSIFSSVTDVLKEIFNDIQNNDERYKAVQKQIRDSMYFVSKEISDDFDRELSKEEFYRLIINKYTINEPPAYLQMTEALRRQRSVDYRPTYDDLALGPYLVMYQMLLLFWKKLDKETETTYRQIAISQSELDQYKDGVTFYWPSVLSSSISREKVKIFGKEGYDKKRIVFVINNSERSDWSPRNIEFFSRYRESEKERTYPFGAKFRVTSKTSDTVYLRLLS